MLLANHKPIAITMGCPVGVGPEIILKLFADDACSSFLYPFVVVGVPEVFRRVAGALQLDCEVRDWQPGQPIESGTLSVFCPSVLQKHQSSLSQLVWGKPTKETGEMMAACITSSVELILAGELTAMVTCPITKSALNFAGYRYPGHTEMLADLCGTQDFAMMMAGDSLRVTLVTIHEKLRRVPELLDIERVRSLIEMTAHSLVVDFGIQNPRIAVAALNPHAGEGGLFGEEEGTIITPAINQARQAKWHVDGPLPPDTVFHKASRGIYDVVICMYHDQGLIPFKLLHFEDGVNVTLGLPIVRTSVDHGTAYDIAGQGVASHASLKAACCMAAKIVANRQKVVDKKDG